MATISVSFTTIVVVDDVSYSSTYKCYSTTYNPFTNTAPSSGNWLYYLIKYDASNPTINIHIDMSGSSSYVLNFCLMGSGGLGGTTASQVGGGGGGTGELSLAQYTYTYSSNVVIPFTLFDLGSMSNCYISNTNNQVIFAAGPGIDGSNGSNDNAYNYYGENGGAGGTGGGLNGIINGITCSTIQGGGGTGGAGTDFSGDSGATIGGASVKFADGQHYTFYGGKGGAPATTTTTTTTTTITPATNGMSAPPAFMLLHYTT